MDPGLRRDDGSNARIREQHGILSCAAAERNGVFSRWPIAGATRADAAARVGHDRRPDPASPRYAACSD
jgi:hypothetical protein